MSKFVYEPGDLVSYTLPTGRWGGTLMLCEVYATDQGSFVRPYGIRIGDNWSTSLLSIQSQIHRVVAHIKDDPEKIILSWNLYMCELGHEFLRLIIPSKPSGKVEREAGRCYCRKAALSGHCLCKECYQDTIGIPILKEFVHE